MITAIQESLRVWDMTGEYQGQRIEASVLATTPKEAVTIANELAGIPTDYYWAVWNKINVH